MRYVFFNNDGYKASLEVGKLYQIIPDKEAASHGYLRIIDESGEDYGYAEERVVLIRTSPEVKEVLRSALERQEVVVSE